MLLLFIVYSGSQCEISPNNCATSQCQNQANCQNVQQAGAYNCLCLQNSPLGLFNGTLWVCLSDFFVLMTVDHSWLADVWLTGCCLYDRCDKPLDVCASNPCQNKGTCVKLNSIRYKCTCAPGYTGYNCQTNISELLIAIDFATTFTFALKLYSFIYWKFFSYNNETNACVLQTNAPPTRACMEARVLTWSTRSTVCVHWATPALHALHVQPVSALSTTNRVDPMVAV